MPFNLKMEKEEYEFPGIGFISLNPPSEDLKPFMRRKFKTCFRSLEANKNGVIGKEDMVKIVSGLFDEYPQEEQYRLSEKFVENIYGTVILFGRDSITENEYTEEWMKKVYSDPKTRKGWIETILPLIKMSFDNIRQSEDSAIGHHDFVAWFSKQGVNGDSVEDLFDLIDANKDGFISLEEFQFGLTYFHMCSGPESPFSLWFGPIIDT